MMVNKFHSVNRSNNHISAQLIEHNKSHSVNRSNNHISPQLIEHKTRSRHITLEIQVLDNSFMYQNRLIYIIQNFQKEYIYYKDIDQCRNCPILKLSLKLQCV